MAVFSSLQPERRYASRIASSPFDVPLALESVQSLVGLARAFDGVPEPIPQLFSEPFVDRFARARRDSLGCSG
ncbi:hypothetical protein [Natronorubrum sp. FCH18a]|uniref:hypothetical protein n=1 Tax=Natronorubrum sp. FCH18a TaxID=3447018 RepID=UPI003F518C1D